MTQENDDRETPEPATPGLQKRKLLPYLDIRIWPDGAVSKGLVAHQNGVEKVTYEAPIWGGWAESPPCLYGFTEEAKAEIRALLSLAQVLKPELDALTRAAKGGQK